jgi:hypothetical protein
MIGKNILIVAKDDVLAAWTVLENLAVSLDQIGGVFGHAEGSGHDPKRQRALQEALATYLTPPLVQVINDARTRLDQYIPDEEAEALSEHIGYWDYVTPPKDTGNPA